MPKPDDFTAGGADKPNLTEGFEGASKPQYSDDIYEDNILGDYPALPDGFVAVCDRSLNR
jgi:hypothetical protein